MRITSSFRAQLVAAAALLIAAPYHAAAQCDSTETADLLCYNAAGSEPQDVAVADVQYIASYLRAYGAQTRAGRLLTMTAAETAGCAEWTLLTHGTALVLAKHINDTVDTSVLFADIATTIDGGPSATAARQAAAIIGCGTAGGSMGVAVNLTNPSYNATTYPTGNVTNGILIKVVSSGCQVEVRCSSRRGWVCLAGCRKMGMFEN